MPRSRASRLASLALLLLAGSVEPLWQLGHAVAHWEATHHDAHEDHAPAPEIAASTLPTASSLPEDAGHGHPIFQAPVRPASDLTLPVAALPSAAVRIPLEALAVRRSALPGVSARASPAPRLTPQPRAPPLG